MKVTVVSLLWVGEFESRHYTEEWVYRLRDQVKANLPIPHDFVCFSNTTVRGVDVIPLKRDWVGWWAKMEIFRPDNGLSGRCVYFDLDVFATGNLTPIALYDAPIAFMPPSYMILGQEPRDKPGVVRQYQASCITWEPPVGREFYEKLTHERMHGFRSDQDWMGYLRPHCATMPKEWFAKARQCKDGVPDGVKLVLAHRVNLIGKRLEDIC